MAIDVTVNCVECGTSSVLDHIAVVATAQVAAFVAAHGGHERMSIELILVAPMSELSCPAS